MKGVKVSLDTKVNPNLVNWRTWNNYNKDSDKVIAPDTGWMGEYLYNVDIYNDGTLLTISFDYSGGINCYLMGSSSINVVNYCKVHSDANLSNDNGVVLFQNDKEAKAWVTYKKTSASKTFAFIGSKGSYIRNVKIELSDHPTDYIDYQGGGNP